MNYDLLDEDCVGTECVEPAKELSAKQVFTHDQKSVLTQPNAERLLPDLFAGLGYTGYGG